MRNCSDWRLFNRLTDDERIGATAAKLDTLPKDAITEVVDAVEAYRGRYAGDVLTDEFTQAARQAIRESKATGLDSQETLRRVSRAIEERMRRLEA